MSEPEPDTLTGFVWGDRVVMAAFVLVAGWTFVRSALDAGPLGIGGVDLRQLGLSMVSIAFWGLVISTASVALGVV
jgi:hypothetical protein